VVNLALVVLLAAIVAVSFSPESPKDGRLGLAPTEPRRDTAPPETRRNVRLGDPKLIVETDLFGTRLNETSQNVELAAKSVAVKAEVQEELPFNLLGTVASDEGDSYAILEDNGTKSQDIYRVGDSIGNARIDSIEQNRIVVLTTGGRAVLDLVLTGQRSKPAKTMAKSNGPVQEVDPQKVLRVVANDERQINTRALGSRGGRATRSYLESLAFSSHIVDGQASGLRVSGIQDSTLARLVGLRNGDVIESINGHSVPNRRKAAQVMKKARQLGSARLQLVRDEGKKSLSFRTGTW
jgi:general secretion pathway protein C